MKICIVDIAQSIHPTFDETIAQIYKTNTSCVIDFYTTLKCYSVVKSSGIFDDKNKTIFFRENYISDFELFSHIRDQQYHKIFVITLEPSSKNAVRIIRQFLKVKFTTPIFFTIHNIDQWYWKSTMRRIWIAISSAYGLKQMALNLRQIYFILNCRSKITRRVIESGGGFIVMSDLLKTNLGQFINAKQIYVVPFSLPLDNISQTNSNTIHPRIHIVVPGNVTQNRRDYIGFLQTLLQQGKSLKEVITLELLGKFNNEMYDLLIKELIHGLQQSGFDLISYGNDYIPMSEYNDRVLKCDFVLGLLNPDFQKYNNYGTNKETGFVYVMIKYLKPGLVPNFYPFPENLRNAIVSYKDNLTLIAEIKKLSQNQLILQTLKINAIKLKSLYSPQIFYSILETKVSS